MTYDSYPPGMTTSDLQHVGEIPNPYDKFYEEFTPTDEQMEEFLLDNITEFIALFNRDKAFYKVGCTWNDLTEWFKEENETLIQKEYDDLF